MKKCETLSENIQWKKTPNSNSTCLQTPAFQKNYRLGLKIFWQWNFYSFFLSFVSKTFHSISCKVHCFCCFHADYLYLHESHTNASSSFRQGVVGSIQLGNKTKVNRDSLKSWCSCSCAATIPCTENEVCEWVTNVLLEPERAVTVYRN